MRDGKLVLHTLKLNEPRIVHLGPSHWMSQQIRQLSIHDEDDSP